MSLTKATLRLFNGILVDKPYTGEISSEVFTRTIRHGYVLHGIQPSDRLLDEVESVIGISGEKANASFHKSWAVVRDTPMEILVLQQIVHYWTTYGFEALGIYDPQFVYTPDENLEIPGATSIPLTVVRGLTADEILMRIGMLASGVALSSQTLSDIMKVVKHIVCEPSFADSIKNRELKTMLYDHFGTAPTEPVEWLRYVIWKLTGETLLIKNDDMVAAIKGSDRALLDSYLTTAPDDLASIFLRHKPLFLAMKSVSSNKTFFNRLRKDADKMHKPLPVDYLNNVTASLKDYTLRYDALTKKLADASIFRKIRLAYALQYRLHAPDHIVYHVRNGRSWATDFSHEGMHSETLKAFDIVIDSIGAHLRSKVEGKTYYIPAGVNYALPATEKQFVGNVPAGSYIEVAHDMIVGIHWTNTDNRVDLDLSFVGAGGKIGWDGGYRSNDNNVLFSGDVTSAPTPLGASESFYFQRNKHDMLGLLYANYFNHKDGDTVDCNLFMAHEKPDSFGSNYMVDPNNILFSSLFKIDKKQNVLGLLYGGLESNRLYLSNFAIGNAITSRRNKHSEKTETYMRHRLNHPLLLADALKHAGAIVVTEKPDSGEFIDLSPQCLDKTTLLDLISQPATVAVQ